VSDIAISVEKLSKKYRIGTGNSTSYHRLSEALAGAPRMAWNKVFPTRPTRCEPLELAPVCSSSHKPLAASLKPATDFWALKDISFEVKRGEVVGIIGRNGAGKSTLLKILSRITEPTSGRFGIRGRVASLLEVGTGFHAELTGRENIYVSGITLGMTRAEIKKRFDEIVDFSGVEKFLDTPVKHYSSGMQVRLGFAVAAHLETEVLIVDEVLAVGDFEFQKKCLATMGTVARDGRTVLVVSHQIASLASLVSKGLFLEGGELSVYNNFEDVSARYRASNSDSQALTPGGNGIPSLRVSLRDSSGNKTRRFKTGDDITVRFQFGPCKVPVPIKLWVGISGHCGAYFGASMISDGTSFDVHGQECELHCKFKAVPLLPGDFTLSFGAFSQDELVEIVKLSTLDFEITGAMADLGLVGGKAELWRDRNTQLLNPYSWNFSNGQVLIIPTRK
jgi:lipopolysaccharide transport system ATP-binding protein